MKAGCWNTGAIWVDEEGIQPFIDIHCNPEQLSNSVSGVFVGSQEKEACSEEPNNYGWGHITVKVKSNGSSLSFLTQNECAGFMRDIIKETLSRTKWVDGILVSPKALNPLHMNQT